MNREAIYAGFWAGLQAAVAASYVTTSRRLEHWNDVLAVNQPALFQTSVSETARTDTGQPGKWELRLKLYIYAKWDEGAAVYTLTSWVTPLDSTSRTPSCPRSRSDCVNSGAHLAFASSLLMDGMRSSPMSRDIPTSTACRSCPA